MIGDTTDSFFIQAIAFIWHLKCYRGLKRIVDEPLGAMNPGGDSLASSLAFGRGGSLLLPAD